jgi:TPP-dependent 2-oxoacid decarboxylase
LAVKLSRGCLVFRLIVVVNGIGDFNLAFLDLIDEVDGLKWSGNCNELNAAYSADGNSFL